MDSHAARHRGHPCSSGNSPQSCFRYAFATQRAPPRAEYTVRTSAMTRISRLPRHRHPSFSFTATLTGEFLSVIAQIVLAKAFHGDSTTATYRLSSPSSLRLSRRSQAPNNSASRGVGSVCIIMIWQLSASSGARAVSPGASERPRRRSR